jgi:Effector Associated Constant Component 1
VVGAPWRAGSHLSKDGARRSIPRVDVLVSLAPDAGADAEESERLGRQLRQELRSLDVDRVQPVTGGEAPAGSKGDVAAIAEWLVTLSASGGVVATLVGTIRDWLGRRGAGHRITLTIDGDSLELDSATPAERAELIDTFVRRHQTA